MSAADRIDLNVDAGESFGAWRMSDDAALFEQVSSANLACGFHAGDPGTIRTSLRLALDAKVAVGAHPGLPDLVGFGRRAMTLTPDDLHDIESAASRITIQGARLPEAVLKHTNQ